MCEMDPEPCELWTRTEVTARKTHECEECVYPITPKTKYLKIFGKFDGDVFGFKAHKECEVFARRAALLACGTSYWISGELRNHLREVGVAPTREGATLVHEEEYVEIKISMEHRVELRDTWNSLKTKYGEPIAVTP